MALDAVLFDLDDTLFDHRHAQLAGMEAIRRVEPALVRIPLARLDRSMERLLSDIHVVLVLTGRISLAKSRTLRMTKFLEEFDIEVPPREMRRLIEIRAEAYRRHRRAIPVSSALQRRLRAAGKVIAVITNNLTEEQEQKLRVTGLDRLIDHLVTSEQVGAMKPDPLIFRAAMNRADAQPRTTVVVGDSWEYDVVGATRLGMRAVWFHRDRRPLPSAPPAEELRSFRPLYRAAAVILGGP